MDGGAWQVSSMNHKESDTTELTHPHTHTNIIGKCQLLLSTFPYFLWVFFFYFTYYLGLRIFLKRICLRTFPINEIILIQFYIILLHSIWNMTLISFWLWNLFPWYWVPLPSLWLSSLSKMLLPFLSNTYSPQDWRVSKKKGDWIHIEASMFLSFEVKDLCFSLPGLLRVSKDCHKS